MRLLQNVRRLPRTCLLVLLPSAAAAAAADGASQIDWVDAWQLSEAQLRLCARLWPRGRAEEPQSGALHGYGGAEQGLGREGVLAGGGGGRQVAVDEVDQGLALAQGQPDGRLLRRRRHWQRQAAEGCVAGGGRRVKDARGINTVPKHQVQVQIVGQHQICKVRVKAVVAAAEAGGGPATDTLQGVQPRPRCVQLQCGRQRRGKGRVNMRESCRGIGCSGGGGGRGL
mmetsp:Transcript_9053/g.27183  ORF Transcript_9053/g.27183 Transcript_9053/m.27183 type:complete len:227 (-) Transcript_9053:1461-2141(-)